MSEAATAGGKTPSRAQEYKDLILTAPYEICIERARYVTRAFRETEGMHPSIRAARAFEKTATCMSISIIGCEGLVGNRTSKLVGTPLPVERGDVNALIRLELDALLNRKRQPYHIDPADRKELFKDILPYWEERSVRAVRKKLWVESGRHIKLGLGPRSMVERWQGLDMKGIVAMGRTPGAKPWKALKMLEEVLYNNPGLVMNVFDVQGHMILGSRNVLPGGFAAIEEKARARLARCDREGDEDGRAFCEGALISIDAIRSFARRYADLARDEARRAQGGDRKEELLAIAGRCDRVPYHPPRDFREAVQALWLIQAGAVLAYGMTGIFAIGRPDQYLYPYYRRDIDGGRITREQALELVSELLVKLSSGLIMLPTVGKNSGSELGADSMAVTVGGVGPDGEDATNDLSFLFLDAVARMKALGNTFSIRVSKESPQAWLDKAAQVYQVTSGPALFNDEVVIEALQGAGTGLEHARDYGVIGCVEPTSDGNTFGCTSGNDISLVGALEMTLLSGRLRVMGRRVGPDTGDPRSFIAFEQLMDAYRKQVRFMVDNVAAAVDQKDRVYAEGFHNPYVSVTLHGCLDSATDMTRGGARYNFSSISARGLGTAADSLAAVKTAVFDRGKFSMDQLLRALDRNFSGHEKMRRYLRRKTPKYGSDDEQADEIAKEVAGFFCRDVAGRTGQRGGPFRPGFFSYGMHVVEGALLGATPDGRLAGEPISNSLSPSNGTERSGPTGVMNSLSRIDHTLISNGCALNIRLLPSLLGTPEKRSKFCAMVRAYFDRGGMEVQFNVVDNATLRDAQLHPERYRDLVVRVSGYSAFFTDLGPAIQNEIISRTVFGEQVAGGFPR
ncbi:MAG: pyruvate formate lyase family protein [Pseudomonadota bacterium]